MIDPTRQMRTANPLVGQYDRDPGPWRPYKYGAVAEVPVLIDQSGECEIKLLNQPFIMTAITHSIIGPVCDFEGTGLCQDGQYFIEWSEEQSTYQSQPLLAAAAYGTQNQWIPFPAPIGFAGNRVLKFRVTNAYTRTLTPEADYYKVQIIVHGIANWGTDSKPQ